jgi:hypothetical protein
MFVVVADNPKLHLTDDFTGVAKLVTGWRWKRGW